LRRGTDQGTASTEPESLMRRLCRFALILGVSGLLAACQTALPGNGGSETVSPNAVAGDPIEVTSLDALPGDGGTKVDAAIKAEASDTAAAQSAPPAPVAVAEPIKPDATPAPKADLEAAPETPQSEMELACRKKGGNWSRVGKGSLRACVFQTRDGGKRCKKESDCDGVCLARSGTCAPIKPLFGCNEILQDNGARVTLCID
jgi:hypothetical protein